MILVDRIGFILLVLVGIGTVVSLGRPDTYRDQGVGWVLIGMAWSGLLFDGLLLAVTFGFTDATWLNIVLPLLLYGRVAASTALLWIIVKSRRRHD